VWNSSCCLHRELSLLVEPSVTHGAVGALGLVYTGVSVSLVLEDEGSMSCSWGSIETLVPVYAGK
jgi:hypothetical protein